MHWRQRCDNMPQEIRPGQYRYGHESKTDVRPDVYLELFLHVFCSLVCLDRNDKSTEMAKGQEKRKGKDY